MNEFRLNYIYPFARQEDEIKIKTQVLSVQINHFSFTNLETAAWSIVASTIFCPYHLSLFLLLSSRFLVSNKKIGYACPNYAIHVRECNSTRMTPIRGTATAPINKYYLDPRKNANHLNCWLDRRRLHSYSPNCHLILLSNKAVPGVSWSCSSMCIVIIHKSSIDTLPHKSQKLEIRGEVVASLLQSDKSLIF